MNRWKIQNYIKTIAEGFLIIRWKAKTAALLIDMLIYTKSWNAGNLY